MSTAASDAAAAVAAGDKRRHDDDVDASTDTSRTKQRGETHHAHADNPGASAAASSSSSSSAASGASAPAYFQRMHRDGLQSIFTFLSSDDLWSARRVCAAWLGAAQPERRRRVIAIAVSLLHTNANAIAAWNELCAVRGSALQQADVLTTLLQCVNAPPTAAAAAPSACEDQLVATHKLICSLVSSSVTLRDELLSRGILQPLLDACTAQTSIALLRSAVACLESLTRLAPQSQFAALSAMLPILIALLDAPDAQVLLRTLVAFASLSNGSALNGRLLAHAPPSIRLSACAAIARICASNPDRIEVVINAAIIPLLVSTLKDEDPDIAMEATTALVNATKSGTDAQIRYLATATVVVGLCSLLTCPDPQLILLAMSGIENCLRVGKSDAAADPLAINPTADTVDQCKGLDYLEALLQSENEEIGNKAAAILEQYFVHEADDEEFDEAQADGAQFAFAYPNGGFVFGD